MRRRCADGHTKCVAATAIVASEGANDLTNDQRHNRRDEANGDVNPSPVQHPREVVPAKLLRNASSFRTLMLEAGARQVR